MINKLKGLNKNTIINTSHIGDAVNESKTLLKGGACTALWNMLVNYVGISSMDQCKL